MSTLALTLTMDDIKSEGTGSMPWQGARIPLPMPSRLPQGYDTVPPPASLVLPYHGLPKTTHPPMPPQPPLDLHAPRSREPPQLGRPGLGPHHAYPTLKRPYETYEDAPYGEHVPDVYEGLQEADPASKLSIQPDHQLLSFAPMPERHTVLDQYGRPASVDLAAQIHGMFFLSEISTSSGDSVMVQPELTCYRRNLFQISGSVTTPTGPMSVLSERGETSPVVSLELTISAMESVDGHAIRLIVIPWKTPPPNSPEVPPNTETEPSPIPLQYHADMSQERGSELTVQPIAWRRLQFRVATANNGRRKELQQHFVLRLKLMGTMSDGSKIAVAESSTAPIVVRGRSPRNFQARKEIPLVGASASPRGQTSQAVSMAGKVMPGPDKMRGAKPEHMDHPKAHYQFDGSRFPPSPMMVRPGYPQWNPSQPSEHSTASTTPSYPSPQVGSVYANTVQSISDGARMPSQSVLASQIPTSEGPSRAHYYHPASAPGSGSLPVQYADNNHRPAKSPRHGMPADLSSVPMYPQYEDRSGAQYPPVNAQGVPVREYYAHSGPPPPETWGSGEHGNVPYPTSMPPPHPSQQPPPQHPAVPPVPQPLPQAHPSQPSQPPYGYSSESYVKVDPNQTHYTWSSG